MLESQTPRPREAIEANLSHLYSELEQFQNDFTPTKNKLDSLPVEQRDQVDGIISRVDKKDIAADELGHMLEEASLPDALGDELKTALLKYNGLLSERTRLEEEFTPHKKADFEKFLSELTRRINYDKIFGYYRTKETGGTDLLSLTIVGLYQLRRFRYNLDNSADEKQDFDYWDYRYQVLDFYLEEWNSRGFLNDTSIPSNTPPNYDGETIRTRRTKLISYLDIVYKDFTKYGQIYESYQSLLPPHYRKALNHLTDLRGALIPSQGLSDRRFQHFESIDFDPAYLDAADMAMSYIESELLFCNPPLLKPTRIKDENVADSKDSGSLPIEISFVGFEPKNGFLAVIDPGSVAKFINNLAPDFSSRIASISYTDNPTNDPPDDEGWAVKGRYFHEFNADKHPKPGRIEIYDYLFVPEGTTEAEKLYAQANFYKVLCHELGHAIHHSDIALHDLITWEEVIADDPTAITSYVQYSRNDSPDRGKREDLAESFAMFLINPAILQSISPGRFQFSEF